MKKSHWLLMLLLGCATPEETKVLDIQGHRGARGLAPENSVEAFMLAARMGVRTLELDLVVSKDRQLVVSHEPYFSPHFCLDSLGNEIPEDSIINMYQLTYEQISQFDCGSKGNPRFPEQQTYPAVKPLLKDVLDQVEPYALTSRDPLYYNMELKTTNQTDAIFHPTPEAFSDLVYQFISEYKMWDKVNIQSFDFRTLQYFNQAYPEVPLALLIENDLPWQTNIDSLGFTPEIYSCYYQLLDSEKVKALQEAGMQVIPWTVNEVEDLKMIIEMGVDGIITDYPDRALDLIDER